MRPRNAPVGRIAVLFPACFALGGCASSGSACSIGTTRADDAAPVTAPAGAVQASAAEPLVIGESFTIDSDVMGEVRHVNVFRPSVYGQKLDSPLPVLYMLDGGMDEDFLHIAGLVQILVSNGSMRPFLLVGIQNTQRRRDLTGPTANEADKKIAPVVGRSATFRRFVKEELMPTVRTRYDTTDEKAIIGESLAGLFVLETFFLEPNLFSSYIAIDPSLWWADEELLKSAGARLSAIPADQKSIFLGCSNEPTILSLCAELAGTFESHGAKHFTFHYAPLATEAHGTIYHPAALLALRTMFSLPRPESR